MTAGLVHRLLERAAQSRPDSVALVDGDRSLTYAELDSLSTKLAATLAELGVVPGDRVGIYLDKSLEAVVGPVRRDEGGGRLRAARSAGSTCAARLHREERRNRVSRDVLGEGSRVGEAHRGGRPAHRHDRRRGARRGPGRRRLRRMGRPHPATRAPGRGGSGRGRPRLHPLHVGLDRRAQGRDALASQRARVRRVGGARRRRSRPTIALSSHAPFHFDLSIVRPLRARRRRRRRSCSSPARASVFPVELARFIGDAGITVWYSVPSILTMLVLRGNLAEARIHEAPDDRVRGRGLPHRSTSLSCRRSFPDAGTSTLRPDRDERVHVVRGAGARRAIRPRRFRSGIPIDGVTATIVGEDGSPVAGGRGRRAADHGPDRHARILGRPRAHGALARRLGGRSARTEPATSSSRRRMARSTSSAGGTLRSRAAGTASSSARSRARSTRSTASSSARSSRCPTSSSPTGSRRSSSARTD